MESTDEQKNIFEQLIQITQTGRQKSCFLILLAFDNGLCPCSFKDTWLGRNKFDWQMHWLDKEFFMWGQILSQLVVWRDTGFLFNLHNHSTETTL